MERTRRFFLQFSGGILLAERLPTPTPTPPPIEPTATPTPGPPLESPEDEQADSSDSPPEEKIKCRVVPNMSWEGKASFYSESGSGCLGCSSTLTMANGQRFNEKANTLAFMRLPLNSQVLVTNLDNGIDIEAIVTDRGGFEGLGKIADLSKGLAERIRLRTGVSNIRISLLDCKR